MVTVDDESERNSKEGGRSRYYHSVRDTALQNNATELTAPPPTTISCVNASRSSLHMAFRVSR